MELVGGRSIHPVNVRLGGLLLGAHQGRPEADGRAAAGRARPRAGHRGVGGRVRLPGSDRRPRAAGADRRALPASRTAGSPAARASRSASAEFSDHVRETQVPHSTALHATLDGRRHLTGPLARYSLNHALLSPVAREAATAAGLGSECRNPFRSIVVRAVETVYAVDEALRIIDDYERPARPFVDVPARRRCRTRGERSAARAAVPPLRDRRGRADRGGGDRPADRAEPGRDRGRPHPGGDSRGGPGRRAS